MAHRWPEDTDFALWELDVLDRNCPVCGRMMHFLRDLARPVTEADSHAKVRMRAKARGLRAIEQAVLARPKAEASDVATPGAPGAAAAAVAAPTDLPAAVVAPADGVVLEYCAAVRGILNDDQGGPLHPAGLRMAEALAEVEESLHRDLGAKKGGSRRSSSAAWRAASGRASTRSGRSKGS